MKTKIVHSTRFVIEDRPNGKATIRREELDEEIPDLGRSDDYCNVCGFEEYPKCIKTCPRFA